jgi:hypothetical protein
LRAQAWEAATPSPPRVASPSPPRGTLRGRHGVRGLEIPGASLRSTDEGVGAAVARAQKREADLSVSGRGGGFFGTLVSKLPFVGKGRSDFVGRGRSAKKGGLGGGEEGEGDGGRSWTGSRPLRELQESLNVFLHCHPEVTGGIGLSVGRMPNVFLTCS